MKSHLSQHLYFYSKGKQNKVVARLGRDQGSPEGRLASLKSRESQQSKCVVEEDLVTSKLSKVVVFPIC